MTLSTQRPSASNRRLRPTRLAFEDLEGRLVMASPVTTPLAALATVRAAAVPTPLAISNSSVSIVVNNVIRNAQTGAVVYSGTISSTNLDPNVRVPFNAVITPARNSRGVPTLTLIVPQTSLSSQGLNVATTGATLVLTPRQGAAGASLIAGLRNAIAQGDSVSRDQASTTLEGLIGSSQVSAGVNRAVASARSVLRSFSVATATSPATIVLDVNPVNVNVAGLNLRLTNGQNRPIRVNLSGTSAGGLLGNGLVGIVGEGQRQLVSNRLRSVFAALISQV